MSSSENLASDERPKPSEETLRQQLDLQWRDHIHVRDQTWRALQMVAVVLLAIIGADVSLQKGTTLLPLAAVQACASLFGMAITIHHRNVQVHKFKYIFRMEERLGLHGPGLLDRVKEPEALGWRDVLSARMPTPTFILLTHVLLLAFTLSYVWVRRGA